MAGVLTIVFDDAHYTALTVAKPILDAAGVVGTVPVSTAWMHGGRAYDQFPGPALVPNQMEQLKAAGWELLGHGHAHISLKGSTHTLAEKTYEFTESNRILTLLGLQNYGMAWPGGQYDSTGIALAKAAGYTQFARSSDVGDNALAPATGDRHNLKTYFPYNGNSYGETQITSAVANNRWLILSFHSIGNTPAGEDAANWCPTSRFQAIVNHAVASGITVRTFAQQLGITWGGGTQTLGLGNTAFTYWNPQAPTLPTDWCRVGTVTTSNVAVGTGRGCRLQPTAADSGLQHCVLEPFVSEGCVISVPIAVTSGTVTASLRDVTGALIGTSASTSASGTLVLNVGARDPLDTFLRVTGTNGADFTLSTVVVEAVAPTIYDLAASIAETSDAPSLTDSGTANDSSETSVAAVPDIDVDDGTDTGSGTDTGEPGTRVLYDLAASISSSPRRRLRMNATPRRMSTTIHRRSL